MRTKVIYGNPKRYYINGQEVTEAEYRAATPDRSAEAIESGTSAPGQLPAGWPMKSVALAVHAKQIPEAMEYARKNGVPTEYTRDGRCIIRDNGHYKKLLKLQGLHHNNSFYG